MTATRNARRQIQGVVVNASSDKTITVEVSRTYKHAKYGKYVRQQKKYMAHDPKNEAERGDTVALAAVRPLSKRKRWALVSVVEKADAVRVASPEVSDVSNVEVEEAHDEARGGDA